MQSVSACAVDNIRCCLCQSVRVLELRLQIDYFVVNVLFFYRRLESLLED